MQLSEVACGSVVVWCTWPDVGLPTGMWVETSYTGRQDMQSAGRTGKPDIHLLVLEWKAEQLHRLE